MNLIELKNINHYCMLTAVLVFICLPFATGFADIPEESGDLMDEIEIIRINMPGKGEEGFVIPTSSELNNWREVSESFLCGHMDEVDSLVNLYFPSVYQLVHFTDTGYQDLKYYILKERAPIQKGWGTFILGIDYQREIAIEIPHARFEINTPSEGVDMFRRTGSRVFIMTGTHRCSNDQWAPCDGISSVCGDGHYHISDVAHNVDCFYQVMHEAYTDIYPFGYSFSIHGTSNSDCPDIFLSNGRGDDSKPIIYEMKERMNNMGNISVSVAGDGSSSCTLTGATNVQGRYTNSSPSPCYQSAPANNGRFIHAEQRRRVRDNYYIYIKFIDAINSTISTEPDSTGGNVNSSSLLDLSVPFPNPSRTEIRFSLFSLKDQFVSVDLFDVAGKRLKSIHSGRFAEQETRNFCLNYDDLSSGVYFIRASAEGIMISRKVLVIR
ncbi:MAG: T9SS type A sorting domain-containing protein [Candidatus Latescibacteria bacterium]|nr:T9SS type A sorting domain-containing protein [bacterium]MBD3424248.1 T9SS type A sorting domain-containing protein [Candidatus Latescibacterota bacterium]